MLSTNLNSICMKMYNSFAILVQNEHIKSIKGNILSFYSIHIITSYNVKDKTKSPEKYSGRGEYVLCWPICK